MPTVQGEIMVGIEKRYRGRTMSEENKSESLEPEFIQPHELAYVGCDFSRTINLGSFESLKLGISATVPCNVKDVKNAQNKVIRLVMKRLSKELEGIGKD